MSLPSKQYSRVELFLNAIATNKIDNLPSPQSRMEIYLDYIAKNGNKLDLKEITSSQVDEIFNQEFKNGINPLRGNDAMILPNDEGDEELWK